MTLSGTLVMRIINFLKLTQVLLSYVVLQFQYVSSFIIVLYICNFVKTT